MDAEWPARDRKLRQWLDTASFGARGRQRVSFSALSKPILVREG